MNYNKLKWVFKVIISLLLIILNLLVLIGIIWYLYEIYQVCSTHERFLYQVPIYDTSISSKVFLLHRWYFFNPYINAVKIAFYDWETVIPVILNIIYLYFYYKNDIFIIKSKIRYLFWSLAMYLSYELWMHFYVYMYSYSYYFIEANICSDVPYFWTVMTSIYYYCILIVIVILKFKK